MAKPWYLSKTLWFNAVVASLAALEAVAGVLQPLVPGNVYAYGLVVLTMGNAVLRVITSEGLDFTPARSVSNLANGEAESRLP